MMDEFRNLKRFRYDEVALGESGVDAQRARDADVAAAAGAFVHGLEDEFSAVCDIVVVVVAWNCDFN
jgi:hypothetical protein